MANDIEGMTGVHDLSDFPVSEYYRRQIREARTIGRTGFWWSAVLLIEDPTTDKSFLAFYRWQKRQGVWKVRKSFNCRSRKDALRIVEIVKELASSLA